MKELIVTRIHADLSITPEEAEKIMDQEIPPVAIDVVNWDRFPYVPQVHFRIAHTGETIWLSFQVEESHVLARHLIPNSPTHKDSCVEFFLDPKKNGHYYNFEFNAIGTVHLAYGQNVEEREFVPPALIEGMIRCHSDLGTQPLDIKENKSWRLTVIIPAGILIHDQLSDLSGLQTRANFFKCGDETDQPHYLTWNRVETDKPSFHQPQYFGALLFE